MAEKRIDFRELVRELFRYAYLLHSSSRLGNPIYEQTVQNSYLDGIFGRCRQLRAMNKKITNGIGDTPGLKEDVVEERN